MNLFRLLLLKDVPHRLRMVCFGAAGAVLGAGLLVVKISNAASYLSDEPEACINCHIMVPQYSTWRRSSHATITNCNDCHVPHDSLVRKYWFKGKDGSRHSAMFTLRMERQVIEAIPESKEVIQANCIRCHGPTLSQTGPLDPKLPASNQRAFLSVSHAQFDRKCTDCHREVPHGRVHSLSSTPNAATPPMSPVTPGWFPRTKKAKGQ